VTPAVPELVATLRRHIDEYGVSVGGRLFVTRTGKAGTALAGPYCNPISIGTADRFWKQARRTALMPEQFESPLARRPYDLRHACLSTWLNAAVPATQVAAWAGHGVMVLLKVYAQCLEGQDEMAMRNIDAALAHPDDREAWGTSDSHGQATPLGPIHLIASGRARSRCTWFERSAHERAKRTGKFAETLSRRRRIRF
jgi:hypothetical protein